MATRPWLPTDATDITLVFWGFSRDATGAKVDGSQFALASDAPTKPTKWTDASGKGNDLPIFGAPGYSASGLSSGHPAATLNGSSGFLKTSGLVIPSSAAVSAMAVSSTPASMSQYGRLVSLANGTDVDYGNTGLVPIVRQGGSATISFYDNAFQSSATSPTGTPSLFEGYVTSTSTAVGNDGTVSTGGGTSAKAFTRLGIGVEADGATGACWQDTVAEAVVWAGIASTATIQKLEGCLAWNNGTQGSLPANHPYKTAAPTVTTGEGTVYKMSATGIAENRGAVNLTERYALRTVGRAENPGVVTIKRGVMIRASGVAENLGTTKLTERYALRATGRAENPGTVSIKKLSYIRSIATSEFPGLVTLVTQAKTNGNYGGGTAYGYPSAYGFYNPVTIAATARTENTGTARLTVQKRIATAGKAENSGSVRLTVAKSIRPIAADEFLGYASIVAEQKFTGYRGGSEYAGRAALRAQAVFRARAVSEYRATVVLARPVFAVRAASSFVGTVRMGRYRQIQLLPATGQFWGTVGLSYGWSNLGARPNPDLWYDTTPTLDPWQTARPTPEL